jgi:hypothetical protein
VHPFIGCSSIKQSVPTVVVMFGQPRPLTMDGVPAGDDPEINDIGYYAPSGDLVLYCGDVGYFNGIVRIGRLDAEDMSVIERQPDGFELMIDRG